MSKADADWNSIRAMMHCPLRSRWLSDGREVTKDDQRMRYQALYPGALKAAFRAFYDRELWKVCYRDKDSLRRAHAALLKSSQAWMDVNSEGVSMGVAYRPLSKKEMMEKVSKGISKFLSTVNSEDLTGRYAKYGSPIMQKMGNRVLEDTLDFLIIRGSFDNFYATGEAPDVALLVCRKSKPSKASSHARLYFNGILFISKFGFIPRLGYYYLESGNVDWLPSSAMSREIFDNQSKRLGDLVERCLSEKKPSATPGECFRCEYTDVCDHYSTVSRVEKSEKDAWEAMSEGGVEQVGY